MFKVLECMQHALGYDPAFDGRFGFPKPEATENEWNKAKTILTVGTAALLFAAGAATPAAIGYFAARSFVAAYYTAGFTAIAFALSKIGFQAIETTTLQANSVRV